MSVCNFHQFCFILEFYYKICNYYFLKLGNYTFKLKIFY